MEIKREVRVADIQMNIVLSGNIKEQTAQAEALNKALLTVQQTANNTSKTIRAASETAAVTKSGSFTPSAADPGFRRGATGVGTGDDTRDFARQAQGLGGLVHVYATFAANIFAVSAAFEALKKAADFSNILKGLDQLGASSGNNLGGLAKRITEITEGAVSLKQASEATAQAVAGGLSGNQLEKLTNIAKTTSQVLGRDLPDAFQASNLRHHPDAADRFASQYGTCQGSQGYSASYRRSVCGCNSTVCSGTAVHLQTS